MSLERNIDHRKLVNSKHIIRLSNQSKPAVSVFKNSKIAPSTLNKLFLKLKSTLVFKGSNGFFQKLNISY